MGPLAAAGPTQQCQQRHQGTCCVWGPGVRNEIVNHAVLGFGGRGAHRHSWGSDATGGLRQCIQIGHSFAGAFGLFGGLFDLFFRRHFVSLFGGAGVCFAQGKCVLAGLGVAIFDLPKDAAFSAAAGLG